MAISKARKEELVEQYVELLQRSEAVFLAEYTGMDVKTMNGLRDKVYEVNGTLHVTKNTLLRHALQESNMAAPEQLLKGQVTTGFALGNVSGLAKAFVDFAKENDKMKIRGGVLGNRALTPADVEALAKLPPLEQLRGQLIGMISAPARNVVSALANGVRQVVNVLDAYANKSTEEQTEAQPAA